MEDGLTVRERELRRVLRRRHTTPCNPPTDTTQRVELCRLFYRAILSDFGACRAPRRNHAWTPQTTNTLEYCAPELLYTNLHALETNVDTQLEFTSDVWALGVTLFAMAFGHLPWQGLCTANVTTMLHVLTSTPLTFPVYHASSR
uniref:Serine/threonine-protein kinase SBK1 n=2 Tax=Lygus hesperus TaxID=30085 RepID=A0A146M096_LYGHE